MKIDHPVNPADATLLHAYVASDDMKTVYDGVVVLDGAGSAWVELPDWFEALNGDFRYQLTPIGAAAPGAGGRRGRGHHGPVLPEHLRAGRVLTWPGKVIIAGRRCNARWWTSRTWACGSASR